MASAYDKASLVMLPHAVKEGKLYSVKPENRSGDFNFSRGTDTATRVNASGLIEKERSNQLLQSNSFATTWIDVSTNKTSGQSGYDGSNDAWLLSKTNSSARLYQNITYSGVNTFSVYAKSGTLNWMMLNNGTNSVWYDLQNGVVGTNSAGGGSLDASIESVGNGWYRVVLVSSVSASLIRIYPSQANNDVSGTSGNIYIQDAQLEEGLVAQPYIETTTAAVYEGITDNLPRLDYSDGASCPSLLLEPSRTNRIVNSEYISAGVTWSAASGMTTQNNSVISPEGVQNATKLIRPNSTGAAWVREGNISATIGLNQVISVFAKSGSNDILNITYYDQTAGDLFFNYDLSDGTISSAPTGSAYYVDAGIEDYGNGWYRCYAIAEAGRVDPQFQLSVGTNRGGAANSYLYIYGASHEKDVNYQTSYIPTYGASASRASDVCNKTSVASLIGTTETTFFLDVVFNGLSNVNNGATFPFLLESGSGGERAQIVFGSDKVLAVTLRDNASDVAQVASLVNYLVEGTRYKIGVSYSLSGLSVYVNGSLLGTDSVPSLPTLENIYINDYRTTALYQGALDVKQALLFKTRLSNAELESLTTI